MKRTMLFTLCAVCVAYHSGAEQEAQDVNVRVWGDVSELPFFQERIRKAARRLLTRCHTIEYPAVLASDSMWLFISTEADVNGLMFLQLTNDSESDDPLYLRGLDHMNMLRIRATSPNCGDPDIEITEGGPGFPNAKIKICSQCGCPLDSNVRLYASKQWSYLYCSSVGFFFV